MMTTSLRKLALTAHIALSVSWIGAVASFLVLSIAGLASQDVEVVRGAYLAMDLIGWFVIVPLSMAALASGLVEALGTQWRLARHYWVLAKLVMTVFAAIALLLHQVTAVTQAAELAARPAADLLSDAQLGRLGVQLTADAGIALLVLIGAATLAVYKPWGRTDGGLPFQLKILLAVIGLAILSFVVLHLSGHGLGGHRL